MKYLVVLVAAVLLIVPAASALTRPGVVRVTTKNLYTTSTSAGPLRVASVYNIVVHGISRNEFRYELAVAGGTGAYANVGGTLNVYRITTRPLRERLVFTLTT
jgi:hypothetical protein